MQFNITFKTIFEYVLKKLVLCIQIRFVSTEKTTRIASRASCLLYHNFTMPLINSLYMYNFTSFTDIHAYIYIIPMSFYCINSALTLTKKRIIFYDKK